MNENKNNISSELSEVTIKIVSTNGHDEWSGIPVAALEKIKYESETTGRWAYIDGNHKTPDSITLEDVIDAEEIMMANALVGG
jgi:hypothetical protein